MRRSGGALTMLGTVLTLLTFLLAFATAFIVLMSAVLLTGRGDLTIDATVDPPYTVVFGSPDGASTGTEPFVEVVGDGTVSNASWPDRPGSPGFDGPPGVDVSVEVGPDDRDTRIVAMAVVLLALAIVWIALLSVRRIVETAATGEPFHPLNPTRFRRLAASVLALYATFDVGLRVVDVTLESEVPVSVQAPPPGWPTTIVVAIVLAALAEIFREGVRLREQDAATI